MFLVLSQSDLFFDFVYPINIFPPLTKQKKINLIMVMVTDLLLFKNTLTNIEKFAG